MSLIVSKPRLDMPGMELLRHWVRRCGGWGGQRWGMRILRVARGVVTMYTPLPGSVNVMVASVARRVVTVVPEAVCMPIRSPG